jgi:Tfp pilus assembly protein PilX
MFFFFSNKFGCLGSLLISVFLSLVLLGILGVINFRDMGGW